MNKRNKVKHLNVKKSHRKALMRNMALSFFRYERITSSKVTLKQLQSFVEKIITKAKRNLSENIEDTVKLHNKREVMKKIKNRDMITKIFEDISVRNKDRNGGYTRIYSLVNRISDNSSLGILELIDKKKKKILYKL